MTGASSYRVCPSGSEASQKYLRTRCNSEWSMRNAFITNIDTIFS